MVATRPNGSPEDRRSGVHRSPEPNSLKRNARLCGTRLGRFLLGPRLGVGGAASVYLARLGGPHNFERLAAVKIIHEHLADEKEFVSMFLDEANLAVRLSHPNIVHVYELGRANEMLYLAMEYLHGQPLSALFGALIQRGGQLPYDVIAWIGARAAEGLHHAHQLKDNDGKPVGLVHRDVSPENVFVTYEGRVMLIDFGIARAVGRLTTTALGHIKGKYRYMAPEQALGRDYDHRVDLFALGATLYEAALGAPVFDGEDEADTLALVLGGLPPDPCERIPGFPRDLADILLRTLATDPNERFEEACDLGRALDAFVARSGRVDQREQLEDTMNLLFATSRDDTMQAIAELRAAGAALPSEQPPAITPASDDSSPPVAPRPWWPWVLGGSVVLAGSVGGALALAGGTANEAPAAESAEAPAAPVSARVVLDVTTQPLLDDAVITIAGRVVEARPARREVARTSAPTRVVVEADGFERTEVEVVPDRDRTVVVPLTKLPATKPGASPSVAAPPDSQPAAKPPAGTQPPPLTGKPPTGKPPTGKPPTRKPPTGKPPTGKPPSAEPASKDSGIITDYPF